VDKDFCTKPKTRKLGRRGAIDSPISHQTTAEPQKLSSEIKKIMNLLFTYCARTQQIGLLVLFFQKFQQKTGQNKNEY
jgi:hypothetical protein